MRQEGRVGGEDVGRVDRGRAADRVEDVRCERQVEHLLHEDAVDHLGRLDVRALLDRVQGAQVGRQRGVLDRDRPLQVPVQVLSRPDRHGRRG